jgi:uncharacterized repeat protein (TIGR03806 family)
MTRVLLPCIAALAIVGVPAGGHPDANVAPYGLQRRPRSQPYLLLPDDAQGQMPRLLSQTGAFESTRALQPSPGLVPYDINLAFWSDGAAKSRWIAVPGEEPSALSHIEFATNGEWKFPSGTVFVKHFELTTDETRPEIKRRLETRLLVRDRLGGVYGVTYKWREDNTDADLLLTNLTESILIKTPNGTHTQIWYYPSRQDCLTCHTERNGGVLGVKTRQLNCDFTFPGGVRDNELRAWNHIGLFSPVIKEQEIPSLPRLAAPDDVNRSLEERARSYLDANCSHCHRPGGTVCFFDARYDTPLRRQELINGSVLFDQGLDHARVIVPNDPWRSIALLRIQSLEGEKMPPLAHNVIDRQGEELLRKWIGSLEGRKVLPPPKFSPGAGRYASAVEVQLSDEMPDVTIRYTLDGSVPTSTDPVYTGPINLTSPTTLRAKAFKPGFTRSITAQQTYRVGE